ncbi:uncharacterized protein BDR25DRAFT_302703 [Lindgomyces ingoldianus]|uniref:Uncharacterized protein n=1 Tax=Lindgomyces ingoldianus TaxID=673940 RepID=A0ACB6R0F8_9PLEO|nr:uncharacterized protein BDR25DRAFT_302703 [Lindgomyces ingoldianus]KAF2472575.1 hypothetical protein BDR25DRAFT_302703 [Lindgomyces ingoldianus]
MGGLSKPSIKDYSPLPIEERIDDGVEEPQGENEASDNEDLYTSSAPLLSSRSRGNGPLPSQGELCWYHRIGSWRPFRRDPYAAWEPPTKRNWRKILLFTFLGTLLSTVLALSISTGVLASKLSQASNQRCYNYRPYEQHTRLPLNQAWESSNNRLNFVRLYPRLQTSPSLACQVAWNTLSYVPCHEKIWNRSWDNGKHYSLFDPDISLYSQAMCSPSCTEAITRAFQLISSQCTEEDKFDMTDYAGTFSADPGLEDGPVEVISTIARRLSHTCRQEPSRQQYYYGSAPYCTSVMWEDWFIVDGMNAGNLEGLDTFEARTHTSRTSSGTYRYYNTQDTCDDLLTYYSGRYVNARRFGPFVNSTSCDWCTMNWFERKLLSWEKDAVTDPKTGKNVNLSDYLHQIKHVGERCDADAWERVWGRALQKYKQSGDLPEDWEDDKQSGDGEKGGKNGKQEEPCKDDKFDRVMF